MTKWPDNPLFSDRGRDLHVANVPDDKLFRSTRQSGLRAWFRWFATCAEFLWAAEQFVYIHVAHERAMRYGPDII
jgi:hypothetical protein